MTTLRDRIAFYLDGTFSGVSQGNADDLVAIVRARLAEPAVVERAAAGIANEVAMHAGSPPIVNVLDILTDKNRARVVAQAKAALAAALEDGA